MAAAPDEDPAMRHPTSAQTTRWEPDQTSARRALQTHLLCRSQRAVIEPWVLPMSVHLGASVRTTTGMMPRPRSDSGLVRIRVARVTELPGVQAIERAAGAMFCDIGMPEIAGYDAWPLPVMAARRDAGRLWVMADDHDKPVAYLMADLADGCLQIEQVSVHPGSARRGLGRALLDHAASRAALDGLPALTLTAYAHVPWNAPYCARCGFRILGDPEITPGLQAIRAREAAMGADRWPRVCMRRDL
jgi:GNAT superfamily N-acetyltransferase